MSTAAVATPEITLGGLIDAETAQPQLAAHLDGLDAAGRVREIRSLSGKQQKKLWHLCKGAPAFTLEDLVPASLGDGKEVIYAGKNSLGAFSLFEKRFLRQAGAVIGYNFQSMSWFTGPGYFTCVMSQPTPDELVFDYTTVPSVAPAGWPAIKPNTAGFSRFVYKNLNDYNRRVSKDVIIGSATRAGKDIDSYYILARS
jgi:hypothetical protein